MEQGELLQARGDDQQLSAEQREIVRQARILRQSRSLVADEDDVEIIDRARSLLRNEARWDRADDRICDESDRTYSLFCALHRASLEVTGMYQHRRTALQEVRFAVEEATGDRDYQHRMQGFNNDPRTSLNDVRAVLAVARSRLVQRLADQRRCRL